MGSFVITDQISSKSQIHHIMKPIISLDSSVLKGATTRQDCTVQAGLIVVDKTDDHSTQQTLCSATTDNVPLSLTIFGAI